MLTGETGIGKTWIAQQFVEECRLTGVTVLQGCCFEGDWHPAYGPWVEALSAYVRECPPEVVARQLGESALPLAPLLHGTRESSSGAPLLTPLSREEERFRLYDAVIQFLLAVSRESSVLLYLDDLHWADSDSLRLLRHVARSVPRGRLLLLGAYNDTELELERRHPLAETLSVLRRELDYQQIAVQGLALPEVADCLTEVAGKPLPKALVRAIHTSTNGNPFYVREVFRHLTEEGKILQRSGRWSTDFSIRELGIPSGVRQLLLRRIDRLSEETGILLNLAAGFSGGFTFPLLQNLSLFSEDVLLNSIDEALRAKLIRVQEGSPAQFDFMHAIVRQTLYEEMNPERRARLHRRIALALEVVYGDRLTEHSGELAFQYHASASLPGAGIAIEYALSAADQAKKALAYEQAVLFLRMARDLSAELELRRRADIQCLLAIGEAEALMLEEAAQTAKKALDILSEDKASAYDRAQFLAATARPIKDGGADAITWEPLVDAGLELLGEERDLLWARLKLLCERVEPVSTGLVKGSRLKEHDPEAVAIARSQGSEDDYVQTLDVFEYRTPEETMQILALARTWLHPPATTRALFVVARDMLYCHGMFREASDLYQELTAMGARHGSILWQAEALAQLAMAQAALGNLVLARNTAGLASEMIARLGMAHSLHFIETGLGSLLAYFVGGDWPELAARAAGFTGNSTAARNPSGLVAGALASFAHCRAGNIAESQRFLSALTAVIEQTGPTMYGNNLVVAMAAGTVWELQAIEHAAVYQKLAFDLIQSGIGHSFGGSHELVIARMASLLGKTDEAGIYFALARAGLEQQGVRHYLAIIDFDEALSLRLSRAPDDGRAVHLLENALATFEELGMQEWAARALEEKEKLVSSARPPEQARRVYPNHLTAREVGVLGLLASGKTNKEIASELVVSVATAERHIANIYDKIGVRSRSEAVAYALRNGLA